MSRNAKRQGSMQQAAGKRSGRQRRSQERPSLSPEQKQQLYQYECLVITRVNQALEELSPKELQAIRKVERDKLVKVFPDFRDRDWNRGMFKKWLDVEVKRHLLKKLGVPSFESWLAGQEGRAEPAEAVAEEPEAPEPPAVEEEPAPVEAAADEEEPETADEVALEAPEAPVEAAPEEQAPVEAAPEEAAEAAEVPQMEEQTVDLGSDFGGWEIESELGDMSDGPYLTGKALDERIILLLAHHPEGLTLNEIAEMLGRTRQSLIRPVNRLYSAGTLEKDGKSWILA
jgi:hypothetical protein